MSSSHGSVAVRALALAALGITLGARPARAQFGTNLIVNAGAEAGAGSASGNDIVPIPGWSPVGGFTVVQYGAPGGFPSAASPGSPTRGNNFFSGGPSNSFSQAQQVILFTGFPGLTAQIDAGLVNYTLSGWFGGFENQNDNAELVATFSDVNGNVLPGPTDLGGVLAADRSNVTGMLFRSESGLVPIGSRFVLLNLDMTRESGAYNDGYADDLSLVLTTTAVPSTAPEPTSLAGVLTGVGLVGVVSRRRRSKSR